MQPGLPQACSSEAAAARIVNPNGAWFTLVSHELYPSKDALDGALSSGMEDGMRETFDQLDALVASLRG
jgi:uncharacterized protein YndB with AHSA1/START domain